MPDTTFLACTEPTGERTRLPHWTLLLNWLYLLLRSMEVGMKPWNLTTVLVCFSLLAILTGGTLRAQQDPGPRGGAAGSGGPFSGLNSNEQVLFNRALDHFTELNSVDGSIEGEESIGLGPTFNGNGCAMCHAEPAIGGSSPGMLSRLNPVPNPQVALATLHNATNTVPAFISREGPIREARFVRNRDGSLDGGVHGLYTIAGRSDAPGCTLAQPNFALQLAFNNVVFRIPTPLFGLGLVEATPDSTLRENLAAQQGAKAALAIRGRFNTSGNDGTITRFGWKAQNKSLLIFAGEAYNVESGVTNENFPNERSAVRGCVFNGLEDPSPTDGTTSDLVNFAIFMRLAGPPTPALPQGVSAESARNGSALFNSIGCALCHTPTLTTGPSALTGMSSFTYGPFSDFALHHMGSELRDGVNQGAAGPDQFRTAPLWGLGQRLYFMHDGRTYDLLEAIQVHADCGGRRHGHGFSRSNCNSEANGVINNFNSLSKSQVQDILNFLRSL
jgi:CxxC motif-containing protein (DUF1111 family)